MLDSWGFGSSPGDPLPSYQQPPPSFQSVGAPYAPSPFSSATQVPPMYSTTSAAAAAAIADLQKRQQTFAPPASPLRYMGMPGMQLADSVPQGSINLARQ